MTVLENLLVAQHNKLMMASGYTMLGLLGFGGYRKAAAEAVERRQVLAGEGRSHRPRRRSGRRPALWRAAAARDRARHVHRARSCCASTSRRPASTRANRAELNALLMRHPGRARHLDPADRARHVGGHADFRPCRGARIRPQDLRRHARASVRNDPSVIAAYLGVDDEEVEEVLTRRSATKTSSSNSTRAGLARMAPRLDRPAVARCMAGPVTRERSATATHHGERVDRLSRRPPRSAERKSDATAQLAQAKAAASSRETAQAWPRRDAPDAKPAEGANDGRHNRCSTSRASRPTTATSWR